MSKKFFINNLDTDFGQALLEQLVKQPTEDPIHMATTRSPADAKPNGIKKIVKRQKPKLFRKKIIEECEVYVYNLNQTEISDIQFGIETMTKPFEDNKVFILVSDLMVWSNSGRKIKKQQKKIQEGQDGQPQGQPQKKQDQPKQDGGEQGEQVSARKSSEPEHASQGQKQQKPVQYTFFEDVDYKDRNPLEKYNYIKQIEDKVLSIKRQNVKVYVVCPGLIYGCGEDNLYPLFKAAWLQQPPNLPYLEDGLNLVPMIHLKDLVKFVVKVAENPPQSPPYLLAFDMNSNRTQKFIIQSISTGVGSGKTASVKNSDLFQNPDRFLINIDIQPSKFFVGTAQQPVEFEWTAKQGLGKNITKILQQFCKKHHLRPIKLLFLQNDQSWRANSKIQHIYKVFCDYYRIPVLRIKDILSAAKEKGDKELIQDLNEEWASISQYLLKNQPKKLDETMKVFYRAVRWRLAQNDCTNRGFILQNFPAFKEQLQHIFMKLSSKKLKRKKKPVTKPVAKKQQPADQGGDEAKQQGEKPQGAAEQEKPPQQQKQQEPEAEQEQQQQGEGPKYESSFPESVISIKQVGKGPSQEVVDFFTSRGVEELIYDTTGAKDNQIFQSLRNYIERNGRPNNYLIQEEQLLKKHTQFTAKQNKQSLDAREKQLKAKEKQIKAVQDQRSKLRDQIAEIVRTQGEEQIKKMPFRNYLMEFVVPTLNEGLLEVSNIIPNDPVDLLAEYLYQKSYDF